MMQQQEMFSGSCPRHGPENVCDQCPERYDTDNAGFVHRQELNGRVPLKTCKRCQNLVTRDRWDLGGWCCKDCG